RGRPAPAALRPPSLARGDGRGAAPVLRGHDQGPVAPVPQPRPPAGLARLGPRWRAGPPPRPRPVPVPGRPGGGAARARAPPRPPPPPARRRRPALAPLATLGDRGRP